MSDNNFKSGDKVKLKDPKSFPHLGTRVLIVIGFDGKFIMVENNQVDCGYFPLYPAEIEKVITKGQQLLFDFMEGN